MINHHEGLRAVDHKDGKKGGGEQKRDAAVYPEHAITERRRMRIIRMGRCFYNGSSPGDRHSQSTLGLGLSKGGKMGIDRK
ncbi:hypothetical protein HPP92_027801 [Vanilla planifolia]|uniref:Uncharacterized protein n=1 Tax=Vanilla planifolia TaxID=51239 RepID=A0A835U721_VANPL|nr:hypothetical protein HPP92_027801 [Vanilla planifolia]